MNSDVPQFLGYAAPGGKWQVEFPTQVQAWCRHLAGDTGCNLIVTIVDADSAKTRRQERGFHACISPWAKQKGWDADHLKQFLLARVFGTFVFIDPGTGEEFRILTEPHTSRLTKRQYSELIDRTMDIAAEDGVILIPPDEWRLIKATERRAAERAARKAQP
jgi:hypothetical protein